MPNLCIEAGPGTGKTYTLINGRTYLTAGNTDSIKRSSEQQDIFNWMVKNLPKSTAIVFFAYGKSIVKTLTPKIHKTDKCYTFNGFGQSQIIKSWGFQKLSPNRLYDLIAVITGTELSDMKFQEKTTWMTVAKIVDACKREWKFPSEETLEYLIQKYPSIAERDPKPSLIPLCIQLLEQCKNKNGYIDYTDQLWLGTLLTKKPSFDIGFVDEAQDQSQICLELAKRACHNIVYCGDPNQAIFAFAGADEHAFERAKANSQDILPLKLSFRCPPNICAQANTIRPNAKLRPLPESKPGAEITIEGHEFKPYLDRMPEALTSCLVLCRTNGLLIRNCLRLLRLRTPAFLLANDITKDLESFVKWFKVSGDASGEGLKALRVAAKNYADKYKGHRSASLAMLAEERSESILAICDALQEDKAMGDINTAFSTKVKQLFRYESSNGLPFSTIHKAKGLEAQNVFILNPPIPHFLAKGIIAEEQEKNLEFVAITRVKRNLIWVKNV